MQALDRRVAVSGHPGPGGAQRVGELAQAVLGDHGRRAQHSHRAPGPQPPLLGQPLEPMPLKRPVEVGNGADRGVLGDGDRVVLPGAVDHG